MPQRDEVYTISDDAVLESMRRDLERRGAMRSGPGAGAADGASARARIRYAQPPASGARALWASTLSLFVCGAGQAYNGQGKLGALLFLTEAFFVAITWAMTRIWSEVKEVADVFGITDLQVFTTVAAVDFLMVLVIATAVYQAYREAERVDGRYAGRDNPVASGLASIVIPGWGQLINGQPGKAIAFLFCFLTSLYVMALLAYTPLVKLLGAVPAWRDMAVQIGQAVVAVVGLAGIVWLLSVYDAVLVAGFRRRMS